MNARTLLRAWRRLRRRIQGAPGLLDRLGPPAPSPAAVEPEVSILLVCFGNVCRSPMAEGLLRRRLARAGLLGRVIVDSAGTNPSAPGRRPDWRARACARRHGDSIRDLRARRFVLEDFDRFDLILAMDEVNERALLSLARTDADRDRVRLFEEGVQVADPAEHGPREFERSYRAIERASGRLVDRLVTDLISEQPDRQVANG